MNPENEVPSDKFQSELNKTVKKYDEALKGMENEVPSDEEILKLAREAEHKFYNSQEIFFSVVTHALSALRAEWKREKEELQARIMSLSEGTVDRIYVYEGSDREAEILNTMVAEKQALEERLKDGIKLAEDQHEIILKNDEEISRLKSELEKVKAENFVAEAVKQVEASDSLYRQQCQIIKQKSDERDTLTCALAEAREALVQADEAMKYYSHSGVKAVSDALSNPTAQRASEEMKALRKVAEVAKYMASNGHFELCPRFRNEECTCGHSDICKALEAYESRGKQ